MYIREFLLGWRVLNISDDEIQLISAGIPLGYYNRGQSDSYNPIADFTSKFSNTIWAKNGFGTDNTVIDSSLFKNSYTNSVRAFLKSDLDNFTGTTLTCGTDITQYGSLIYTGGPYWLGEQYSPVDYMWCIHDRESKEQTHGGTGIHLGWGIICKENGLMFSAYGTDSVGFWQTNAEYQTCGTRILISIHGDVATEGRKEDGTWTLK